MNRRTFIASISAIGAGLALPFKVIGGEVKKENGPPFPHAGTIWYDTDVHCYYTSDGGKWVPLPGLNSNPDFVISDWPNYNGEVDNPDFECSSESQKAWA